MPAAGHRLDAVEQHRLVGDRDELLRRRVRDRAQARALAARQDQALELFHGALRRSLRRSPGHSLRGRGGDPCHELQRDALGRLGARRRARRRRSARRARSPTAVTVSMSRWIAAAHFDHHAAQLQIVLLPPRPGACSASRARGCGPSATSRTSTPSTRRRGPRTRAASGAASRRGRSSRTSASRCSLEEGEHLRIAHRDRPRGGSSRRREERPRRRRAPPRARRRARARPRRPASLSTSRTRNSMPLKVDLDDDLAVLELGRAPCAARAPSAPGRARSSPVRSASRRPCRSAASRRCRRSGSALRARSKRCTSVDARLIRSSRK